MEFTSEYRDRIPDIIELFRAVFSAADGKSEADLVAGLVRDMFATTAETDLLAHSAWDGGALTGCILFTRIRFPQDSRTVFILSPAAVAAQRQGQGIGQALIRHGLSEIRKQGADAAVTYGDPAYYGKVGFQQITEAWAAAPVPLNHPEGWLAQSLTGAGLKPLHGPSECVPALRNPVYW